MNFFLIVGISFLILAIGLIGYAMYLLIKNLIE